MFHGGRNLAEYATEQMKELDSLKIMFFLKITVSKIGRK